MALTWSHRSRFGISALIHLDTHFTDDNAGVLREMCYRTLRRHWYFVNELKLFEIGNEKTFSVNVYGYPRSVDFYQASGLYHPSTVINSYHHNGDGPQPGFKNNGSWDVRPHLGRIQRVDESVLMVWRDMLESADTPLYESRMLYAINTDVADVLARFSGLPRIGLRDVRSSSGWNEHSARKQGYFEGGWSVPTSWDFVVLQGPHLFVGNPIYKNPNRTLRNKQDWSPNDLEAVSDGFIPATAYSPIGDADRYGRDYTHWDGVPARDFYRIAWRRRAANTGERTLIAAIIPPGAAHVHQVNSMITRNEKSLVATCGMLGSLLSDFLIRAVPKGDILPKTISRLPAPLTEHPLAPELELRILRLNCVTSVYADLWGRCWNPAFRHDSWTQTDHVFTDLGDVCPEWSKATPLRRDSDRREALVEIDALVALMLEIPSEELCTVYRTQFGVLSEYDAGIGKTKYIFDANGRIIPNTVYAAWQKKGDAITAEERTATNASGHTYIYKLPFETYDREADMTTAYHEFEHRLARLREQGSTP